MPELSAQLLSEYFDNLLPGLPQREDLLYPRYGGYSLANLPSTICKLLGIPEFGEPSLPPYLMRELGGPYKKVILMVVDALGYYLLKQFMDNGKANFLKQQLPQSFFVPLTSICPSTTASALTTLWTGETPAVHGIIGYEMWAKEYGMVINNILHSAMSYSGDTGGLVRAGFNPDEFLGRDTLGLHLSKYDVNPYAYMHYSIGSSGLSSMHLKGVNLHGYISEADMWVSMRNKLNSNPNEKMYIYAYWSTIDTLTHRFSLADERLAHQFSDFVGMMQTAFIDLLTESARKDTLLLITADHGSVYTPRYDKYDLIDHPVLTNMLRIQPTCENRLAFLYIKPGMEQAIREYFSETWPEKFSIITYQDALSAGLFGSDVLNHSMSDRVGDLIVIAHEDAYLWWANKTNIMLGRHGGLNPEEMLIPFFALPL
ncbi:MAG: alkaline phosphatase family protein [Anaerolineaceae bacterium]|nr:alkaline phosphatase family protein [Anaerolineaceae bacterium]